MIRCGLFCSTFWDDLKTLRIIRESQTSDMPTKEANKSCLVASVAVNGPYAPFGFESIEKQLWRNKQNDRPISDSEIKAVLSQLFKTDQWLPPAGHVSVSCF
ncbi:hypothetical protein AVEN_268034-1 [Araneus ventricosus]|uniref:Uncharacterized protein n=1 Tax=Araneus ventricosus TaxID=182803 RepID=A0A4Y2KCU7_ARAVE|nr:hypothetical protein AVEN_268034-1 [Araneus ventricosus]